MKGQEKSAIMLKFSTFGGVERVKFSKFGLICDLNSCLLKF